MNFKVRESSKYVPSLYLDPDCKRKVQDYNSYLESGYVFKGHFVGDNIQIDQGPYKGYYVKQYSGSTQMIKSTNRMRTEVKDDLDQQKYEKDMKKYQYYKEQSDREKNEWKAKKKRDELEMKAWKNFGRPDADDHGAKGY